MRIFTSSVSRVILAIVLLAAFFGYVVYETREDFMRLRAVAGIALFIGFGFIISCE